LGRSGLLFAAADSDRAAAASASNDVEDDVGLRKRLAIPSDRKLWDLFRAIDRGWTLDQIHELTRIDPWFLQQFAEIAEMRRASAQGGIQGLDGPGLRKLKRAGFGGTGMA